MQKVDDSATAAPKMHVLAEKHSIAVHTAQESLGAALTSQVPFGHAPGSDQYFANTGQHNSPAAQGTLREHSAPRPSSLSLDAVAFPQKRPMPLVRKTPPRRTRRVSISTQSIVRGIS